MSVALASRVAAAVDALDDDARQALSLRERDGADYRTIADELGTGREGVADLLVQARLAIRSHLRDGTVPPRRTPQCGPARRVLTAQADGEAVAPEDLERAREHLGGCDPCRAARLALREAEIACHTWSTTPPDALDAVPPPSAVSPDGPYRGAQATQTVGRAVGAARVAGRRRLIAAAVGLVLLIAILVAALSGGGDEPLVPAAPTPGPGSAQGSGKDVVDPPGDTFCPAGQPDCK